MKKIIWLWPNGDISETTPVEERNKDESEDEYLEKITKVVIARRPEFARLPYHFIDEADYPTHGEFSDWSINQGKLIVDTARVKERVLREVRKTRERLLLSTDGLAIQLLERGAPDSKLTRYRQSLRDLPAVVLSEIANLDSENLTKYKPVFPVLASDDNTTQDKLKKVVQS